MAVPTTPRPLAPFVHLSPPYSSWERGYKLNAVLDQFVREVEEAREPSSSLAWPWDGGLCWRRHELRQSHQIVSAAAKAKAHPTRWRPRKRVLSWLATVLIQPKASSMRLRIPG